MITIPVFVVVRWGFVVLGWGLYICVVAVCGPYLVLGVGLWVVVLFENSIVCHLMKQTLLFEREHGCGHQKRFLVFAVCCLFLFC